MVTPWRLPIVPIVWESIVLDDPPTPARTGLLLFIPVYPHISTDRLTLDAADYYYFLSIQIYFIKKIKKNNLIFIIITLFVKIN